MPKFYTVEIKFDGRPCHGDWRLMQGGRVHVGSAWGSVTVEIAQDEDPKSAAQLALERIVAEYARQRAEDRKHQERELAKLSRPKRRRKPE